MTEPTSESTTEPEQPEDPTPPPARRRTDPLLAVLAGLAAGIAFIVAHHPRTGLFVCAASVGVAAMLRGVLRPRAAGGLVVRNRRIDVAALAALAVAIAVLAAITPFPPLG